MNIGEESEPVEMPVPLMPGEPVHVEPAAPEPAPAETPAPAVVPEEVPV